MAAPLDSRWGMPARRRGGAAARVAVGLLVALGLAGCASRGDSAVATQIAAWTSGPLRWLLLEDEERSLSRLRTASELALFERAFWRRREPSPVAERSMRELVEERIAAADRLYGEPDRPGSLTDRGRALVLLGSPFELRALRRAVPVWRVTPQGRPGVASRLARVEIWGYRAADLSTELRLRLAVEDGAPPAEVTFLAEDRRLKLIAGEGLLELAARALAHATDEPRRRHDRKPP